MNHTQEQIQARYDTLPDDLKQAMNSVDTTNALVDIGQKHDLMYDQIEELVDEVSMVMLGFVPSSRFVSDVSRRLRLDTQKSLDIARDINSQIFDKMRRSLQKIEAENEKRLNEETAAATAEKAPAASVDNMTQKSVISAVEAAGGFVIDKPARPSAYDQATEKPVSKQAVLDAIEKDASVPTAAPKVESSLAPDHLLANPASIVDTLLANGVAMPVDNSADAAPQAPKPETPAASEAKTRPYDGSDPYREPIN